MLDEATAAAEAMMLAYRACRHKDRDCFFIAEDVFPQVISVVQTRAHHLGIQVVVAPPNQLQSHACFGVLLQQNNRWGEVCYLQPWIEKAHQQGALVAVACDWMALQCLTSPGAQGADIAFGSSQRFGVPIWWPPCCIFCDENEIQALDARKNYRRFKR